MKDHQFIQKVFDVIKMCDNEEITDKQGIKKIMRSCTKYMQKKCVSQEENE